MTTRHTLTLALALLAGCSEPPANDGPVRVVRRPEAVQQAPEATGEIEILESTWTATPVGEGVGLVTLGWSAEVNNTGDERPVTVSVYFLDAAGNPVTVGTKIDTLPRGVSTTVGTTYCDPAVAARIDGARIEVATL